MKVSLLEFLTAFLIILTVRSAFLVIPALGIMYFLGQVIGVAYSFNIFVACYILVISIMLITPTTVYKEK